MKKARWIIISALLIAGMAPAAVVTLDENTSTNVANWYGTEAGIASGTPTGVATSGVGSNTNISTLVVGMVVNATATNLTRSGLDFDVSGQQTTTNATLKLYLSGKTSPSYDLAVYAKTTGGSLHVSATTAKTALYESGYVDTGLRIAKTTANGTWFAFDVTSYVTNAVANGGIASFRFQMLNDTNLTFGTANSYTISSFKTIATAPSLELYTISGSATLGLFIISSGGILLLRRKVSN
jgi:hypothetical protein